MVATFGTLTGLIPESLAGQTTVDKLYFFINDHLGTPKIVTDDAGTVVWKVDYPPFGDVDVTVNGIESNLRFAGQYYDGETGLHYNYHRYYDPATGRYLTPDPIGLVEGSIFLLMSIIVRSTTLTRLGLHNLAFDHLVTAMR